MYGHGRRPRMGRSVRGLRAAGLLLLLVAISACGSSVGFDSTHSTQYLTAGKYAVTVADECGTPIANVAGQITGDGWSYPLLSGTPLTLPTSGNYTVVDPIGWDLMGTPPPTCALTLKVSLTPIQH
jgi:hypothetical protein